MLIIPRHKFEFAKFNSLEEKVNQTYNLTGKIIKKKTSILSHFFIPFISLLKVINFKYYTHLLQILLELS